MELNTPYMDMNTSALSSKSDYLTMMSAPDHAALSSPHEYVNAPPTIFTGNSGRRLDFDAAQAQAVELAPMLADEDDNYLKPINVQARRLEFMKQQEEMKRKSAGDGEAARDEERDSGYYNNTPRNIMFSDLRYADEADETDGGPEREQKGMKVNAPPNVGENYVNVPRGNRVRDNNTPSSFSNPSYVLLANRELNQTRV